MSLTSLPDPTVVLAATDWSALEHAYGTAEDTPAQLVALLDPDQGVRSGALDHLDYAVLHQGHLPPSTWPASSPTYVPLCPSLQRPAPLPGHCAPNC